MILNFENTRRALIVTTLLIVSAGCVRNKMNMSGSNDMVVRSEIDQAFKDLTEAVKSLDIDWYLQFFDGGKFTSLNADGSVFHSLTEFKKPYQEQLQYIEKYEFLKFSNLKITVISDTAGILVNEYDAEVLLKSGDTVSASGAGTQIWSKASGEWKLVHVSSSTKK